MEPVMKGVKKAMRLRERQSVVSPARSGVKLRRLRCATASSEGQSRPGESAFAHCRRKALLTSSTALASPEENEGEG